MNNLVFFCVIILLITRCIGLGSSVNFYYDSRKAIFLYFIFGWILAIIGNIFPILIAFIQDTLIQELYLVINVLLALISSIILMIGVFSYYLTIQIKFLVLICSVITLIAILLYIFLDYRISISFSVFIMNLTFITSFLFPLFKLTKMKDFMKENIRWYFITSAVVISLVPVSFFIFIQGEGFGLYYSNNGLLIILNYSAGIATIILFIVFLIHLEYFLSNERQKQIKDNYSHNLGNIMQVINSSSDLLNLTSNLNENERGNIKLIQKKCKEAEKLINDIRNL